MIEDDVADLRQALEEIVKLDRSPPYEYGEGRPSDDARPGDGKRWLTPRERALVELRRF